MSSAPLDCFPDADAKGKQHPVTSIERVTCSSAQPAEVKRS